MITNQGSECLSTHSSTPSQVDDEDSLLRLQKNVSRGIFRKIGTDLIW